jgi:hypothetical protein
MTDTAQPITEPTPPRNFPTIFADNVVNLFHGGGIVKFYFSRFDSDPSGIAVPTPVPFCQIVMPIVGFAAMTVFFQQQLELILQKDEKIREIVDQMKVLAAQSQPQQGQPNAS